MRRYVWWMFGLYCLLAASEWLLAGVSLPLLWASDGLIGGIAVAVNGRRSWPPGRDIARLAVAAGMLLGVPQVMAGWALGHVSGNVWTSVLGLVPAIVVMIVAQEDGGVRRMLAPAVAGLGGMLLLVPVTFPESSVGRLGLGVLLVAALITGLSAVWIWRLLGGLSWVQGVAVVSLANAVVLFLGSRVSGRTEWGMSGSVIVTFGPVVLVVVELLLLVGLLQRMEPVRLGVRFLVVPLLTIVEGFVLLRPGLTVRMATGGMLLAGSAVFLLVGRREEGTPLTLG